MVTNESKDADKDLRYLVFCLPFFRKKEVFMNYIITIARGYGSGGTEIGIKLGQRLGIPCYEHQILRMASEKNGVNEALFNLADEKLDHPLSITQLKGLPFDHIAPPSEKKFTSNNNLFNMQSEIIRELANTTSCIIVGKCADWVLREYTNTACFYIEAPRANCVASVTQKLGVSEAEAHKLIEKTDKYRADYYKYYTHGNEWTNPINYDMTLNSDKIGRDRCVDIMQHYIKMKFGLDI